MSIPTEHYGNVSAKQNCERVSRLHLASDVPECEDFSGLCTPGLPGCAN